MGKIEQNVNPALPGGDDYFQMRNSIFNLIPTMRPYANDNPEYFQKMSSDQLNLLAATDPDVSGYNKTTNKIFQSTMELNMLFHL